MEKVSFTNHQIGIYHKEDQYSSSLHAHFHNLHEIIIIQEGVCQFIIGSKTYIAKPNSMVFISSLENHETKVLEYPYKRYVIYATHDFALMTIKEPTLLSIFVQRPEAFSHVVQLDNSTAHRITSHANVLLEEFNNKYDLWTLRSSGILNAMLIELYRYSEKVFPINVTTSAVKIVLEVQKYIARNFNKGISLDEIADLHYISKYYLSRIFKDISGYNLKDYIILHKITAAKDLLCNTDLSVSEIGSHVGYPNVNHFIRIFNQHEGLTPLQYRKIYSFDKPQLKGLRALRD